MKKQIIVSISDLIESMKDVNSKYDSINRALESLDTDLKNSVIDSIELSVFLNLLIEELNPLIKE